MKKVQSPRSENECIGDLKRQFVSDVPRFQSRRRTSPAQASGGISLAWYRGKHSGVYEAYLTLKEDYPEAASALLEAFGMNEEGSISF